MADTAVHFTFDLMEAVDFDFDCCSIRILVVTHELLSAGALVSCSPLVSALAHGTPCL